MTARPSRKHRGRRRLRVLLVAFAIFAIQLPLLLLTGVAFREENDSGAKLMVFRAAVFGCSEVLAIQAARRDVHPMVIVGSVLFVEGALFFLVQLLAAS